MQSYSFDNLKEFCLLCLPQYIRIYYILAPEKREKQKNATRHNKHNFFTLELFTVAYKSSRNTGTCTSASLWCMTNTYKYALCMHYAHVQV